MSSFGTIDTAVNQLPVCRHRCSVAWRAQGSTRRCMPRTAEHPPEAQPKRSRFGTTTLRDGSASTLSCGRNPLASELITPRSPPGPGCDAPTNGPSGVASGNLPATVAPERVPLPDVAMCLAHNEIWPTSSWPVSENDLTGPASRRCEIHRLRRNVPRSGRRGDASRTNWTRGDILLRRALPTPTVLVTRLARSSLSARP